MKKLLFIVPSLEIGGTISSLTSIHDILKSEYLFDIYPLAHEGNKDFALSNRILKKNKFVHLYNCTYSQTKKIERFEAFIIKILKRISSFFKINLEYHIYKQAIKGIQINNYDYVIGFQEGNATYFASLIHCKQKIAWVHCDYSKYPLCNKEFSIYNKFDKIICVSAYTANVFSTIYPQLKNKTSYIYNLLNIQEIINKSKEKINDIQLNKEIFTILSIGRISAVKRFSLIPSIANKLMEHGIKFQWIIIGPNYNDECYKELLRNIKLYKTENNVFYLGNKNNPYPYYRSCNLLVSLSQTEACPMIFNEAKILKLPIITTDFPTSYEFITEENYGQIVPLEQIPKAIINFKNSPHTYQSYNSLDDYNAQIINDIRKLFI